MKNDGEREGHQPFKCPGSYFSQRGRGDVPGCPPQQSEHGPQYLQNGVLTHPGPHTRCKLPHERVHCCLPRGWGQVLLHCELKVTKLTTVYHPSPPLEVVSLQQTPEFQNGYVRVCQGNSRPGEETESWGLPLHHLPRIRPPDAEGLFCMGGCTRLRHIKTKKTGSYFKETRRSTKARLDLGGGRTSAAPAVAPLLGA